MARAGDESSNPLTAPDENQVNTTSTFEKFAVPIVFTIFVTFRAADRVFSKAIGNALAADAAWSSAFFNIIWPFAMQFITLGMVSGYVISQRMQGHARYDCKFFLLGYKYASEKGAIPTYMLGLFSLFDQLNAALSAPANPFVSQPIQSVLTNFVLIFTALVGYFWISTRFVAVHYIGMALVVAASLVQFAPFIVNNDCDYDFPVKKDDITCFEAYHSNTGGGEWVKMGGLQMLFFYVLFTFSTFPSAVGNVYKQKVLQGVGADIFYVTWWSGWFQVLWGWLCIPIMWLPLPGQDVLPPQNTFKAVANTFQCLAGTLPTGYPDADSCTSGTPPWVYVILYFSFNATFNLCITWLIKRISATWVQVATVLCLNLCNILSSQKWIMGPGAQSLTAWDWAAAIITSIALWVYNMQPEKSSLDKEDAQVA